MSTAVFTIVSQNYFHFARTLMKSVEQHHPEWDRFVLLVDEISPDFTYDSKAFELLTINQIALPNFRQFVFRYTILELNTAVKPYMFDWLFQNEKYDKVIYIDPDIHLYGRMEEVTAGLDEGNLMVLTPHLTEFLEDGLFPREVEMLKNGIFNLGFLAVSRHKDTEKFIKWWMRKLEYQCLDESYNGYFVDQKWMDMVSGYFEDIKILRHAGYNIAYWNASHRKVEKIDGKYFVNGLPLIFFHYSGIDLSRNDILSRHTNRFNLKDLGPAVEELYFDYVKRVLHEGANDYRKMKYAYANFNDGTIITNEMRKRYRNDLDLIKSCAEDPFRYSNLFLSYKPTKFLKKHIYNIASCLNPLVKDVVPESIRHKIKDMLK